MSSLVQRLAREHTLPNDGLRELLESPDASLQEELRLTARAVADERFGRQVRLRALIEWSNLCRNNCLYCGIRRSNSAIPRYSLSRDEILACCEKAHLAGLRTFVLQGGENPRGAEQLVPIVREMRENWPDTAITLSLGELPFTTYARLKEAGADRYLLRHESASREHYVLLHPSEMSQDKRLSCLQELRRLGFQTGMGMMVGSPWQTTEHLIADLRLMESFRPEMAGIGPFIPHRDTPLGGYPAGSADLTLRLYSILRLMLPDTMIPSTTALSTLLPGGRLAGILAGANVIMPNFTPGKQREAYTLYNGKPRADVSDTLRLITEELAAAGYTLDPGRGDYRKH